MNLLTSATQSEMEKHSNDSRVPNTTDLVHNIAKQAEEECGQLLSEDSKKILEKLAKQAWQGGKKATNLMAKLSKKILHKGDISDNF